MIRSAAYRIAIVSSLAYAAATVTLGIAVYWAAHNGLRRQFDDRIKSELAALVDEYRLGGEGELRREIVQREAAAAASDLRYALFAPDGTRLVGNFLGRRPATGLQTLMVRDMAGEEDPQRALAADLRGGERLVVAADWDALEDSDRLILSLLAAACVAVGLIGAAGALLLGAYLRRRLSAISVAAEGIMAGDLAQRIVIGTRGDEFDRLSGVLNAMLDRIAELLENLRQVSGEIAHDLRTPLTQLRNQLETGLVHGADATMIERAIARVDEALALFAAILRLSEIESGRLAASFRVIDLSALAAEIGESYAPAVEDRGRTLHCAIEQIEPITGDRELVAQALVNLIENAQTHTPPGTAIRLALHERAGCIRLIVADDGPGVPAGDRKRIVTRFARLEESRSRPGHGLGLSLVAAIARAHRARLSIEDNAPGLRIAIEFAR
ncbi:sensor histidine kinase [Sphingomonas morindae]|uniref:histidine kinase n=1 Tax=Sphingomonas morindae TaxID=1541170 RepID=A0ABY4X6P9_9SPHN|nr:ATP-binding protein [Sphingomonas morindae]USI72529.1 HAMP domain-containing protein [Sphingomonas morindae]